MIKLLKGDCLELMKEIPSGSIDAIITDPPYGTTACKWDSVIDFELMWEQLNRIIKPNGAIVLFGSEPFSSALRMSNIKNYKYDWVWEKDKATGFFLAKKQPLRAHENISIFYKKQPTYNPQKTTGHKPSNKTKGIPKNKSEHFERYSNENGGQTDRFPRTVQYNNGVNSSKGQLHPTQKPILLMEYLIKTYTNENETVLDFTMGSGTTMVACQNTNRSGIGMELDENYFNVAVTRVDGEKIKEKLDTQLTFFENTT